MPPILSILRSRPGLLTLFSILLLLTFSSFIHPDPSVTHLQLPGLWPSKSGDLRLKPPGDLSHEPVYDRANLSRAQERRYSHLRKPYIPGTSQSSGRVAKGQGKYLFVTLTRNIEDQLPDLLNTFAVVTSFLGAENVRFSILEGPSDDATPLILTEYLVPMLRHLGVRERDIVLRTNAPKIDFDKVHRIEALAEMRNQALEPLWKRGWDDTVAVIFMNDVYLRARDVLELLHQHVKGGEKAGRETGVTSGLDWWKKSPEYYYDIWVARTIEGDLFYPMPNTYWSPSTDLFSTSPSSLASYQNLRPFPAFATWAGVAVLAATPFLAPHHVRFRRSERGTEECAASECELVNRDFWREGWGRVQVVPSVQVAYERDVALDIIDKVGEQMKRLKWQDEIPSAKDDITVAFTSEPPSQVKCHPWPEKNGLDANVWETSTWGPPWLGSNQ